MPKHFLNPDSLNPKPLNRVVSLWHILSCVRGFGALGLHVGALISIIGFVVIIYYKYCQEPPPKLHSNY